MPITNESKSLHELTIPNNETSTHNNITNTRGSSNCNACVKFDTKPTLTKSGSPPKKATELLQLNVVRST
uniref:Uncharacterized protein n=1 Tax=Oryza brachyantha TaxID=4533 RepID=J3L1E4_ORYBR